jgi:hypothetical protein
MQIYLLPLPFPLSDGSCISDSWPLRQAAEKEIRQLAELLFSCRHNPR